MQPVQTDHLVVGAGAMGMAFTDTLVEHGDGNVLLVDQRHAPGGHWHDAYPFVRLHLPSAYYGVPSLPLGEDRVDVDGPNTGWYELASAPEICAYYDRVLRERLLPTGRVSFRPTTRYGRGAGGEHLLTDLRTGETTEVVVRRRVVDATYLEVSVPATHTPSFAVEDGARVVPVGGLLDPAPMSSYVVLGAGKTAIDACLHLLRAGVDPDRIRWVRPRDPWLFDRAQWQPLDQVASVIEGVAAEIDAMVGAESVDDLLRRLEAHGRLVRIDPDVEPTMFRCATVSAGELAELRRIRDVIRLGRVRSVGRERLVLEHGSVPIDPDAVVVDCTARALRDRPPRPVFDGDTITLQQVQYCSPCLNAAVIGYVEATRSDDDERNRLCPPNPYPSSPYDWPRTVLTGMTAARGWSQEPDLDAWFQSCRLNLARGLPEHADDPRVQAAFVRFATGVKPAVARLRELVAQTP